MIQRDLTGTHSVTEGEFKMNMKTISVPGGDCGLKGTIQFSPGQKAPESKKIRLYQIARVRDEKDANWTYSGAEADRNKIMTTADPAKGIEGGFHVDILTAKANPRATAKEPSVSHYYRDYAPNPTDSQDGSKSGKMFQPASLWDFPHWTVNSNFSLETTAQAADGHNYGSLKWGFRISDAAKGTVTDEQASAADSQSATSTEALRVFNEFYKNPGSSKAPK